MMKMWLSLAAAVALSAADVPWKDQGVVHNRSTPVAKMLSIPVRAVRMGPGFWTDRMLVNKERSLPTLLELLESHGIVDNFRRVAGTKKVDRRGPLYTDSDLYKWMEAAAFVQQSGDDPQLRATVNRLTAEIAAAQEPSGYLNTWYVEERKSKRFTEMNRGHELYCLGHLLQAGIAWYRATGNRNLLDIGVRFANYMVENFGAQKRPALTGHPELEMAMVELYRTTHDRRYLDFAGYLLSGVERERLKLRDNDVKYMFSGKPFISRAQFEGHAVRAMYAASGAADYQAETRDPAYAETLERLWQDAARTKTYLTGGVGSRAQGEAFGEPYELPNAQAYTESCAAIAAMMWNWRLLLMKAEPRFADSIERALYNGINSGMSLDGTLYCYRNPLESAGEKIRNPWYDTTCCPPNLQRTFASLPGYLYGASSDGVFVNFFHSSTLEWKLESGVALTLEQVTGYPWKGTVDLTVKPASPAGFALCIRIPEWASGARVSINRAVAVAAKPGTYHSVRRTWRSGDTVRLELPVAPRLIEANPRVRENFGRVAVERGPLVYCLEQPDNPGVDVLDAILAPGGFTEKLRQDLSGGVVALRSPGLAPNFQAAPLYGGRAAYASPMKSAKPVTLELIPYFAWANRGPASMKVWLPVASR
jgi:uncharacterized protein